MICSLQYMQAMATFQELSTHQVISRKDKRAHKLETALETIPKEDQAVSYGMSEFCIVSWGSTKGPILDAIEMLKKEDRKVGFVQIKLLQPFPTGHVKSLLKDAKTIIDIEANHSAQMGSLINEHLDHKVDYYILKYTGRPMTCTEIYESVKKILDRKAEKRQVLTYGV